MKLPEVFSLLFESAIKRTSTPSEIPASAVFRALAGGEGGSREERRSIMCDCGDVAADSLHTHTRLPLEARCDGKSSSLALENKERGKQISDSVTPGVRGGEG